MRLLKVLAIVMLLTFHAWGADVKAPVPSPSPSPSPSPTPKVTEEPEKLWQRLEKACDSGWTSFEEFLRQARMDLQKELKSMSQEEYDKRDDKEDPKLVFMSVTWPGDLADHDEFWKSYEDCAKIHFELRKTFS